MSRKSCLFEIADRQQGYFTTQQAVKCGYSRTNLHRYVASGEWVKEQRGIYRLVH
ncbi:MAG: type IV toxin-antitoxin system AbiEi family antitoxin domain-containing protein [Verrucomicrobia bacterium]|nr:type IV toxin-antitoxin system AbiEi family antitoxin domain-containing protein [Verrucomicrobiota bacterium]